jgi:hypothetical protein
MTTFEVDAFVTGADRTSALVNRLSQRLADGRPALLGLVDQLTEAEAERFAGRGVRWRKLAKSTLRIHRRAGRGDRPLILTGTLMRSLTIRSHPLQIVQVRPTSLRFGTRVWYAHFSHRGQGVPKRTVTGLSKPQRRTIVAELRRLLLEDK